MYSHDETERDEVTSVTFLGVIKPLTDTRPHVSSPALFESQ